jgi:hypothetical protein
MTFFSDDENFLLLREVINCLEHFENSGSNSDDVITTEEQIAV